MEQSGHGLVVEGQEGLAQTLALLLRECLATVSVAGGVKAARAALKTEMPRLIILDFVLPDGTGLDVLADLAGLHPKPAVIALSGEAVPRESFVLARHGVRAFLTKPASLGELRSTIQNALTEEQEQLPEACALVGRIPISELEVELRRSMIVEALSRSQGSLSKAAKILDIPRQRLQHMLKSKDLSGSIPR